jgi:hypothetical protein
MAFSLLSTVYTNLIFHASCFYQVSTLPFYPNAIGAIDAKHLFREIPENKEGGV